jgi:hypothetical protein
MGPVRREDPRNPRLGEQRWRTQQLPFRCPSAGKTPKVLERDLIKIYLQDHMAGARIGLELARRTVSSNAGSRYGAELSAIGEEIEKDKQVLAEVMERLGVRPDPVKQSSAWLGEKLGRLKLNGQLRGYSPLSRLLELEGLIVGVSGKLELWRSLAATRNVAGRLEGVELTELIRRAEDQRERLESLHERAAREALAAGADGGS